MAELRALTVRQPWSWAIAEGWKPVENRTWKTGYRRLDPGAAFPVREAHRAHKALTATALLAGALPPEAARLGFHCVVAVAALAGVHHARECRRDGEPPVPLCSPWAFHGEYHWQLEDVRPLHPVPCHPGRLGLWRLPDDVEKAVRVQLEEAHAG